MPSHSALVTGAVIFAFLLFLAARNRLGVYGAALFGNTSPPNGTTPAAAGAAATSGAVPATAATPAAPVVSALGDTPLAKEPVAAVKGAATTTLHSATSVLTDAMNAANGGEAQTYASSLESAIQLGGNLAVLGF